MQIVINHVTRMTHPRICVAGIDPATHRHVRPVTAREDLITRGSMRANGGPFALGALVDIGSAVPTPDRPETEDHRFATRHATHIEDLDDDAYLELLGQASDPDMRSAFGPDLVEIRPRKFAFPAGRGTRSLAVVPAVDPQLRINFGNLYMSFGSSDGQAKVHVTDIRFYEADHTTLNAGVVDDVKRRLRSKVPAYIMLGLARAMPDPDGGDVHWLMANGLCLADRAVGDLP
jgi:hypothetical protein